MTLRIIAFSLLIGFVARAAELHWAFQPIRTEFDHQSVDDFVQAGLKSRGLSASPEADKFTLMRRASFDLLGLPPAQKDLDAFLADTSPDAFAKVVDQLLASPHYGERWGRYWLDVARYSDTKGYVFQEERRYPFAYTYRDWVIQALNDDMPYNRFVELQIAADQLVDEEGPDKEHLAAMGFLTVGRRFLNREADIIDDRIDVVTRGTLGLTVVCARCHDHPNDPIPTKDYYSLYGVFDSSEEPNELPLLGEAPDTEAYRKYADELNKRMGKVAAYLESKNDKFRKTETIQKYLQAVIDSAGKDEDVLRRLAEDRSLSPGVLLSWKKTVNYGDVAVFALWRQLLKKPETEWAGHAVQDSWNPIVKDRFSSKPPQNKAELVGLYAEVLGSVNQTNVIEDSHREALRQVVFSQRLPLQVKHRHRERLLKDRDEKQKYRNHIKDVHKLMVESSGAPSHGMVMIDKEKPVEPAVFVRGKAGARGEVVPRQFLSIFASHLEVKPFQQGSGRLELARSITDPKNPLTSRVIVNRVWMHHFGQGLVDAPSDFGVTTRAPSHPELLDFLSRRFMDQGWSLKKLHREIMLSATYRQSSNDRPEISRVDPENRRLWRMNRKRLDFEGMHDSLLAASAHLDSKMGGRPKPLHTEPFSRRRAIYGTIERQNLPMLFRTFDFASPDAHTPKRHYTTMPQQALYMLNGAFVREQAKRMTERPEFKGAEILEEKVQHLYKQALRRGPDAEEIQLARNFVGEAPDRWPLLAQALLTSNEFMFID